MKPNYGTLYRDEYLAKHEKFDDFTDLNSLATNTRYPITASKR